MSTDWVPPAIPTDLTALLCQVAEGDPDALRAAVTEAYQQLKLLAHAQLARLPTDGTLCTTAVVHEAYLKLAKSPAPKFNDRAHFFTVASKAMRHILIDYVRRRRAARRGGSRVQVPITVERLPDAPASTLDDLLSLDEALHRLGDLSPRLVRVVECRFFGGLSEAETALALGVSERTIRRDWVKARAWLRRELEGDRLGVAHRDVGSGTRRGPNRPQPAGGIGSKSQNSET